MVLNDGSAGQLPTRGAKTRGTAVENLRGNARGRIPVQPLGLVVEERLNFAEASLNATDVVRSHAE